MKFFLLLLLFSLLTVSYSHKAKVSKVLILIGMKKEVDDVARNSPYNSKLVASNNTVKLPKDYLASGITYDWDRNEYLLISDHPHTLMPKKVSTLITLDSSLRNQNYTTEIPSDSDLEGIAYIGEGIAYSISETGLIYVLERNSKGKWVLLKTLGGTSGISTKVSSLALDTSTSTLYTAEKEGRKTLYAIDLEGRIIDSITLTLDRTPANIDTDFTISGIAYQDGKLLILSEAYSTIFIYDIASKKILNVVGLDNTREVSGLTINGNKVITAGDQENYIPEPVLSEFSTIHILENKSPKKNI